MPLDLVDELIQLRRGLPEPARTSAGLTKDATGLALAIPGDALFWLEVAPVQDGWQVTEVFQVNASTPSQRTVVAEAVGDDVVDIVDREYRRLLIERRNAACGTPTRPTSTPG